MFLQVTPCSDSNILISMLQGPAQAQNLRDSLAEAKSDIVVKVRSSFYFSVQHISALIIC
jgi:TctA family transporter